MGKSRIISAYIVGSDSTHRMGRSVHLPLGETQVTGGVMKKRAKFAVLGLSTGIYLTVGGFGLYVYYIFLAMKITHRKYLLETEEFLIESLRIL